MSPARSKSKSKAVDIDALMTELGQLSLTEVDIWRAAFCAVTVNRGWNTAQISRYLGVSRERVRQRIERLQKHSQTHDMPILTELFKRAKKAKPTSTQDVPVGFLPESWVSQEFALGIIHLVVGE